MIFMARLQRMLNRLVTDRAHANVVIVIQDGVIQRVRLEHSFLPANLPEI